MYGIKHKCADTSGTLGLLTKVEKAARAIAGIEKVWKNSRHMLNLLRIQPD